MPYRNQYLIKSPIPTPASYHSPTDAEPSIFQEMFGCSCFLIYSSISLPDFTLDPQGMARSTIHHTLAYTVHYSFARG